MNWPLFVQLVWDGLVAGSIYALMAFSFSLIYFTTRILHFAHGAVMVALTYVIYSLCHYWSFVLPLAIVVAVVVGAFVGVGFERGLYRTVQRRTRARVLPTGALFISSLGMALIITNSLPLIFGAEPLFIGIGPFVNTVLVWNNRVALSVAGLWTVGGAVLILTGMVIWLLRSEQGRRIRAIIDDPLTARIVGIPIEKTNLVVFAVGSGMLAAVAANEVELGGAQSQIGHTLMVATLTATVIGGLGSLYGAIAGGFLVGLIGNVSLYWLPTSYGSGIVFVLLLVFIAVRPTGLLGHRRVAGAG